MSLTYKIASTTVRLAVLKKCFKEQGRDARVCKERKCKGGI